MKTMNTRCVQCARALPKAPVDERCLCWPCALEALGPLVRRDSEGVARPGFFSEIPFKAKEAA